MTTCVKNPHRLPCAPRTRPHDRAAEIAAIKNRGPEAAYGFHHEFEQLRKKWLKHKQVDTAVDDFFAIRAVTLLEVFSSAWIAQLIDHGAPYIENVANLKMDLKFDLALVRAIHGRTITLGDLVAHSLSFNSFGQVSDHFKALLGTDLIFLIEGALDTRITMGDLMSELSGKKKTPKRIITDVADMKRAFVRLFEVKHILVHEFPRKEVYDRDEITAFLISAEQFANATNKTLNHLLLGDAPKTTVEMLERAGRDLKKHEAELDEVMKRVRINADRRKLTLLKKSEKAWKTFRKAEWDVRADVARGGTLATLLALVEADTLTRSRIEGLKKSLDDEED